MISSWKVKESWLVFIDDCVDDHHQTDDHGSNESNDEFDEYEDKNGDVDYYIGALAWPWLGLSHDETSTININCHHQWLSVLSSSSSHKSSRSS